MGPCAGRAVALTLAEKQKYNTSKSCNKSVEQIYVLCERLGFCAGRETYFTPGTELGFCAAGRCPEVGGHGAWLEWWGGVARASWGRLPGISQVVIVRPANMSYSHRHCSDPQNLWFRAVNITVCDMSIIVEVVLLSGSKAIVEARLDESVARLKNRAPAALEVGRGRLLDSSGRALVGSSKIIDSSVRSGDCLSLHLSRVQIQATAGAFAAILGDGSVVTWGNARYDGGDSSTVQDQLRNVQQVQASYSAFAAVLGDGSVVTWGNAEYGGDNSAVQDQLKNVQQVQASEGAFAAVLVMDPW